LLCSKRLSAGLEFGLLHLIVSVWICASVVVWSAFGCVKKKKQEPASVPPLAAVVTSPAATPRVCPPSPFIPASTLPAGKKKIQPLSSTTFLRVPHEYVKDLTIKGVLGLGASGRSYLASLRGSPVAVKVMDHNVRAGNTKLLGDMPVLAVPLDHPNILRTYRVRKTLKNAAQIIIFLLYFFGSFPPKSLKEHLTSYYFAIPPPNLFRSRLLSFLPLLRRAFSL